MFSNRVVVPVALLAALGGAFAAGSLTAAGPRSVRVSFEDTDARQVGAQGSCGDLLASYVARGSELVGPDGWGYGAMRRDGVMEGDMAFSSDAAAGSAASVPGAGTVRATNSAGGTNVQEAGVDEPDVVKTDGSLLVRVQDGDLVTYDVSGPEVVAVGSLPLEMDDPELLLAGDTVVAVGSDDDLTSTVVQRIDVGDPAAPTVQETASYDAALVAARLHGTTVRVVLSSPLPELAFTGPRPWRGEESARERNQEVVAASVIGDWLPSVSIDGGESTALLDCDQVSVPTDADAGGLGTTSVVGFDAGAAGALAGPDTTALAMATAFAYASPQRLYLVGGTALGATSCCWSEDVPSSDWVAPGDGTTRLHELDLAGTGASYAASGEVEGLVADRWALDEHDGVLRVAVGPTVATGDFNSVITLRPDGTRLVEVGHLDKLGPREAIQSVRWFDDLAIVVTFRQTDPLYAVDLSDPAAPALLGALKIPGFSDYLHPLGADRMLGIGQGPVPGSRGRWGAQVGLFDVTDLTAVSRLDVLSYSPGTTAGAGADPRQFTWLPTRRTALSVVSKGYGARTGWVSVLTLSDGAIANQMVEVEHGRDVDAVRLVPLPDDRVVLVTGDGASFFDL